MAVKSADQLIEYLASRKEEPFCLAIDGPGTSGKTTLAERIAAELPAEVIHVDDFFLPFEKRSESRLAEPMGNIEWERLEAEILKNLGSSNVDSAPFDCAAGSYGSERSYNLSGLVVVEGVSSLRKELRDYYSYKLFITIPSDERLKRILRRDPAWKQEKWQTEWIPWEENYFSLHNPQLCADLILDGTASY